MVGQHVHIWIIGIWYDFLGLIHYRMDDPWIMIVGYSG